MSTRSAVQAPAAPVPAPRSAPVAPAGQQPAPETSPPATQRKRSTPQILRSLTTALILLSLLFAVAGVVSFAGLAYALNRAQGESAQLIRVQKIQTLLLSADATATNAFLVGGLEPPAQRASYDADISSTGALIAEASDAQPADETALAALNQAVTDYAVTIEQARANNRQGFPVGAQYLRNASAELRSTALPILDLLVRANAARAAAAMNSSVALLFEVTGLLSAAALVVTMIWVARRFKRRINPGLVAATAVILVAWIAGFLVLTGVQDRVTGIRNGAFSAVLSAADARVQANNAKSNESLTLIARGSGASFEQAWVTSARAVDSQLTRLSGRQDLRRAWGAYKATHVQIRALDDAGSWDSAVRLATGNSSTSANVRFAGFDRAATSLLQSAGADTSSGLAAPRALLIGGAVLTFAAGLAAALLARAGLAARLREYR